jgi:hypothetical protein
MTGMVWNPLRTLPRNQTCPCQSGLKFKECCFEKNEIAIPHIDFIFSKEISKEKQAVKFPYDEPKNG